MKNRLLAETIIVSIYCDIVLNILKRHTQLSINKLLFFCYILKKGKFNEKEIYTAKNSKDLILKCISQLSGGFEDYCNDIEYILKAIHLLLRNGDLIKKADKIIYNSKNSSSIYIENKFIEKCINNSNKITDRQFLKEIIHNV